MSRRMDTVRWAACALEFFVLYLLGVTPNLLPAVAGVLPVPLAAAAIAAAMFETELPAMGFGIFAGVLIDFGMGSVMGFHACVLAVLCFAASWLCRNLFKVNLLTCGVLCLAGAAILFGLQWVFFCLVPEQTGAGHIFVRYILPRVVYSALFCLPAYPVSRALFNATAPGE
ncbi:MAG: rod shape-determining protein MreD [Clostridia bacterium]|nr:rod shape-determining protein MreD [Clostridia bacterium]